MYCPKCGTQNTDETKFCRSCGENLAAVSQAMTKRLPSFIANKLEAIFASAGTVFLIFAIQSVLSVGFGSAAVAELLAALIFYMLSSRDMTAYKRSRELDGQRHIGVLDIPSSVITGEVSPANSGGLQPASVTESTTRKLESSSGERNSKRK